MIVRVGLRKRKWSAHGALVLLWTCLALALQAQTPFTNSATLTAAASGANLVIAYSMTTTQGWVTLVSSDGLRALTDTPQVVGVTNVPASKTGQFVVPLASSLPARFYRLLVEQWPSALFNYPDLSVIIPPGLTSVVGTGTNRVFRYTHDTFNGGAGPLAIQPVYNPASGHYQGFQQVYFRQSGTWTLVLTNPVAGAFIFDTDHGHFHFPFASFGLYYRNPDGSVGAPAALSEKTGFCIADSFIHDPNLPNAGAFGFSGAGCSDPTSLRGLSIGAADRYNDEDPGQSITIGTLPNGRYWLRATADPDNFLLESNETNNDTYLDLAITNNTVTEYQTVTPGLPLPPIVSLTSPGAGSVAGTVQLEATTSATDVDGVQFLVDGLPFGAVVSGPPYVLAWDSKTVPNGSHWLAAQATTTNSTSRTGTSKVALVSVDNVFTNPPVVTVTSPASNATVSAVVTLAANAAAEVGIPSVQFYANGVPVGTGVTNPPFLTSWNTLATSNGSFVITATAEAAGGLITTSAPVMVTVDNSNPPNLIGVAAMVHRDSNGSLVSPAFSTAVASNLILAFVAYDGPPAVAQTASVSGAGLTWQLASRGNSQNGTSEIWWASATNLLSSVTVTSQPGLAGYDGSLTVIAFTNASGLGIANAASAPTGAPEVYIPAAKAGSWVYAVGNDWDGAVARIPVSGQVIVHEWVDAGVGDTFWVQSTDAPLAGDGVVNIQVASPSNHQWNFAAVEIVATRQ